MKVLDGRFAVGLEQQSSDVTRESKNGGLLGQRSVLSTRCFRGGHHEHARDREEQDQGVNFLLDARGQLGSELALTDVVALHDFEEFFDLPAHVIELAQLVLGGLLLLQTREEEGLGTIGRLEPDGPERERRPLHWSSFRRIDPDDAVVAIAFTKFVDHLECMRRGNTNEEVDSVHAEPLQDLVGGIASVEDEHVAASEAWKHVEKVLALARSEGRC